MPRQRAKNVKRGRPKRAAQAPGNIFMSSKKEMAAFRAIFTLTALTKALNPFPPTWRAVFTAKALGSVTAGSASTTRYDIRAIPYQPWNGTVPLPNLTDGSSDTLLPSGYGGLLSSNGPYLAYRCIGTAARVEWLTSNAGDNCMFILVPTDADGVNHATASKAASAWGAQSRLVGFGNGGRSSLSGAWSTAAACGVDAREVLVSESYLGTYAGAPATYNGLEVWYATADGGATSGTMTFVVTLAFDVLLENPNWGGTQDDLEDSGVVDKRAAHQREILVVSDDEKTAAVSATATPSGATLKLAGWNAARKVVSASRADAPVATTGEVVAAKAATKKW